MCICRVRHQIVTNTYMAKHNALWLSGRSGGVYHICKIVAADIYIRLRGVFTGNYRRYIDRIISSIIRQLIGGGDNTLSAAVLYDRTDTVSRILRIAGNERSTRLVHTEHAAEKAAFSRQQQNYAVTCLYAHINKIMSGNICAFVQLTICQRLILCDESSLIRIFICALFKQLVQQYNGYFSICGRRKSFQYLFLQSRQIKRLTNSNRLISAEHFRSASELVNKVSDNGIIEQFTRILQIAVYFISADLHNKVDILS